MEAVTSIPVLGNGDIFFADDALRMVTETGCDGVVVGRGCLGRPWLFVELEATFAGRQGSPGKVTLPHGWLDDPDDDCVPEAEDMHSGG